MLLKPTRYEAEIEIDAKPEFKSHGKAVVAMGIVGQTDAIAAAAATDKTPAVDAVPSRPIWGIDLHMIQIRKATTDPRVVKQQMVDTLRKIASEIEQADLGAH